MTVITYLTLAYTVSAIFSQLSRCHFKHTRSLALLNCRKREDARLAPAQFLYYMPVPLPCRTSASFPFTNCGITPLAFQDFLLHSLSHRAFCTGASSKVIPVDFAAPQSRLSNAVLRLTSNTSRLFSTQFRVFKAVQSDTSSSLK